MRLFDHARQIVETAGTDRYVALGAATAGMQTFLDSAGGVEEAFVMPYRLTDALGQWEDGIGVVTTEFGEGDIFDRQVVIRSSNAGSRIDIDSEAGGFLECVPFIVSCMIATAAADVANVSQGPQISDEAPGALAAGDQAIAGAYGTALGCQASAFGGYAVALGALTNNLVPGAVASSDSKETTARGHALDWTSSATSSGTTPVAVVHQSGSFAPAESSAYVLDVQVVGRRTAPSAGAYGATIRALVLRSGSGAPTIVGQAKTDVSGGLTCDCSLSVVSNTIQINAQGAASGETWYWAATVRATEQRGA